VQEVPKKKPISVKDIPYRNKTGYIYRTLMSGEKLPEEEKSVLLPHYRGLLKRGDETFGDDKKWRDKRSDIVEAIKLLEGPKFKKTKPVIEGGSSLVIRDNGIQEDELGEMAGFKRMIESHPRMSEKEYKDRVEKGMRLPRNEQQLKAAFLSNMNPLNYPNYKAFDNAKKRIMNMSPGDFGKLLAAISAGEEEVG
jgi:hypothetical protein